jgi:hypothetical protein
VACLVADRAFIMYSLIGLVLFGVLAVGVTKSVSRNRLLILKTIKEACRMDTSTEPAKTDNEDGAKEYDED